MSAFLERYLDHARLTVQPKTLERYKDHIRKHINPAIGNIPLGKLTPMHVNSLYTHLRTSGRLDGKGGLSERTVLHIHNVLHSAFKCAVRWQALPRNPMDAVDRPKPSNREMHYLSEADALLLLDAAKETRYAVIMEFALKTGMRRGEILGLKWQDISLDEGMLSVRRSLEQTRHSDLRLKAPKTKRSVRRIDLSDSLVDTLRSHRVAQSENRLLLGAAYQNNDMVFCRDDGTFLPPNQVTVSFKKFVTKWGRGELNFHSLRHTYACTLLLHNVHPKVVSECLGHSSIAVTMDTYSHVIPTLQKDAARAIEDAFGRRAG